MSGPRPGTLSDGATLPGHAAPDPNTGGPNAGGPNAGGPNAGGPNAGDPTVLTEQTRFELTRLIAEGGMGKVYEARQHGVEGFRKRVAVKLIHGHGAADPRLRQRFITEAKLAAHLVHQNIVQIYQLGLSEGSFYIVMEYLDGVTLAELIKRHRAASRAIPISLAAFIASRVCRGLEHAHKARDEHGQPLGVVHRDLSPSNIMISVEGEVKLTDFGIAKTLALGETDDPERLVGTPGYMSPEQMRGTETDRRSDLFSLGVVLHELLTLHPLFPRRHDIDALTEDVVQGAIEPASALRPDTPPALERVLERALARELRQRYQSASAMSYDLEYFMYAKGIGPTIVTLEHYLREVFPEIDLPLSEPEVDEGTRFLQVRTHGRPSTG